MTYDKDFAQRLVLAVVALLSFAGNLFFVFLFLRNRQLLRKAYHMIVLSLASTDMFTGGISNK